MKLLAAFLCVAAARKAPKKFENAQEMTLDAPAIESSKDQLFCVAPPDAPAASLILLYLIRRAGGGFKSKFAAAGLYTLLVLRKGGTIVKKTLLDHWELALIYMVMVAAASCWVVGVSRKSKNFHETVRVACRLGV